MSPANSWEPKISERQTKARNNECLNVQNNFCFHVNALMSLFIGENSNPFLGPSPHQHPLL